MYQLHRLCRDVTYGQYFTILQTRHSLIKIRYPYLCNFLCCVHYTWTRTLMCDNQYLFRKCVFVAPFPENEVYLKKIEEKHCYPVTNSNHNPENCRITQIMSRSNFIFFFFTYFASRICTCVCMCVCIMLSQANFFPEKKSIPDLSNNVHG